MHATKVAFSLKFGQKKGKDVQLRFNGRQNKDAGPYKIVECFEDGPRYIVVGRAPEKFA